MAASSSVDDSWTVKKTEFIRKPVVNYKEHSSLGHSAGLGNPS